MWGGWKKGCIRPLHNGFEGKKYCTIAFVIATTIAIDVNRELEAKIDIKQDDKRKKRVEQIRLGRRPTKP